MLFEYVLPGWVSYHFTIFYAMIRRIYIPVICFLLFAYHTAALGQSIDRLAEKMAATCMQIWPDSFVQAAGKPAKWSYEQGVFLKGIERIWVATGNPIYFDYIQHSMDYYVQEDGTIKGYKPDEYNIDHLNNGNALLLLYKVTGKDKYKLAVQQLHRQLATHPRTKQGGFWHKNIYPWQMWLDGLYMAQPFYAAYAALFAEDSCYNDIANQFVWMEQHARDAKTGLLYHGWDESRRQQWANKATGTSPQFWARALGWYGMALVDVLDYYPESHPRRKELIAILNRLATAVVKVQDTKMGLWYNIIDKPAQPGNYPEASASAMLIYTLAKGMRKGYLPMQYAAAVQNGYTGLQKQYIRFENGRYNQYGTVSVSGLGGNPYRDGSIAYYLSEPVAVNDPKGLGAVIKCATEVEMMPTLPLATGKTVVLDRYFNSEKRPDPGGRSQYWHYVWHELSHPGFYTWGSLFEKYGARLSVLDDAPTAAKLAAASVYIITDPDHLRDNPLPNYVQDSQVAAIKQWVEKGGSLVLMANDSSNCDLEHFNKLAGAFGVRFTGISRNMVKNDTFEQGLVMSGNNEIFSGNYKLFVKELSTLAITDAALARPLVEKDGDIIMAVAKVGKGKVFVLGDPWLYNEYVDGRKLPAVYENFRAADQLARWLLTPTKK